MQKFLKNIINVSLVIIPLFSFNSVSHAQYNSSAQENKAKELKKLRGDMLISKTRKKGRHIISFQNNAAAEEYCKVSEGIDDIFDACLDMHRNGTKGFSSKATKKIYSALDSTEPVKSLTKSIEIKWIEGVRKALVRGASPNGFSESIVYGRVTSTTPFNLATYFYASNLESKPYREIFELLKNHGGHANNDLNDWVRYIEQDTFSSVSLDFIYSNAILPSLEHHKPLWKKSTDKRGGVTSTRNKKNKSIVIDNAEQAREKLLIIKKHASPTLSKEILDAEKILVENKRQYEDKRAQGIKKYNDRKKKEAEQFDKDLEKLRQTRDRLLAEGDELTAKLSIQDTSKNGFVCLNFTGEFGEGFVKSYIEQINGDNMKISVTSLSSKRDNVYLQGSVTVDDIRYQPGLTLWVPRKGWLSCDHRARKF